jgi:hypothetical protein
MAKRKPTQRSARAARATAKAKGALPASARSGPARRDLEQRLADALEQQTATAEILRIIRRSPADVQPVFDLIAERAMRLCGALHGGVCTYDGKLVHLVAHVAASPEQFKTRTPVERFYSVPPGQK